MWCAAPTSARVKIIIPNNATMQEAYQFDLESVTSWNFASKKFRMDIKGNHEQLTPFLSITSDAGQIIVDDTAKRVLHFLVPDTVFQAAMPPGRYVYDFIMATLDVPPIRTQLMYGDFILGDGITGG